MNFCVWSSAQRYRLASRDFGTCPFFNLKLFYILHFGQLGASVRWERRLARPRLVPATGRPGPGPPRADVERA
jgi:hypothetical protein